MEHHHHKMLSVWFFVGVLLLAYGIIILAEGLINFHQPSHVVLSRYHAPIWAGAILIVVGGLYTALFRPQRHRP